MCPRVIFGHFLSQGTRYAITTEASFHGASTFLRVFRGVFRSFSRGLNHPETCAGAFIRSALVLFALLPLLEPGASLTSTEGTSKTVSSVSERSQPSCLAASHSSRQVGFPFIIQTYVVVCVCVWVVVCFTLTDRASTIPSNIRGCQSGTWSQRGTKVNGSHHGVNPLLRPTGIQIATKRYATLQAMAPTNNKIVNQTSFTPYREQPRSTRVVVAYPRPAFSATNRTNTFQPVLINNSKFLKATHRTKTKKIEIPRSMVVEALS